VIPPDTQLPLPSLSTTQGNDSAILEGLAQTLLRQAGGLEKFSADVPLLFRRALDEVIDSARTGRLTLDELEKTEKTYIGTKIEILFRGYLKFPKGKILDLCIDGAEVDIKNTIAANWTIPQEAYGHPCVLMSCKEKAGTCSVGLFMVREEHLNPGFNKDKKRTISQVGLQHVRWILRHNPYPKNFWEVLPTKTRNHIMSGSGGTERMARLFRLVQRVPIPRNVIDAVAQQDDPTRRIRKGGGARDKLRKEGIAIFSGENDRDLIAQFQLPFCTEDEFISVSAETPEQARVLREKNWIL
jgi:hypothetical protein